MHVFLSHSKMNWIFISIFLYCLITVECGPTFAQIDNELVGDPAVDCEETMVSLTFKTKKPFNGRVYVQGQAEDERCSRNFASNTDQSKFSMMITNGDCTMQRQRVTGTLEGMMLSLTIVVSFHGTFVTKSDRAYRCMCFFRNIKHLTSAIDINLIGTTELLDTAKTPGCLYSIHAQSPDGPAVSLGKVGDKIFHVWECDDPTHGFLVHSCSVDDGRGSRFDLLDVDGCAIDPIIQPDVVYDVDNNRASVETFGYKFSDTSVLNYQCTIELCKKSANECQGLTPPICGRHKRDMNGRSKMRRSINATAMGDNTMDLLATVKIIDKISDADVLDSHSRDPTTQKSALSIAPVNSVQLIPDPANSPDFSFRREDCLRSMVLGFSISLLTAICFIVLGVAGLLILKKDVLLRRE